MSRSLAPSTFLLRAEDFFFPPGCLSCHSGRSEAFEGGVCRRCWADLPVLPERRCGGCDLPLASPAFEPVEEPRCGRCLAHPPAFDALRSAAPYAGVAREIVKAFKYGGADYLAPHLAARMVRAGEGLPEVDAVLPVPATGRELRAHRFFPAGELAREFSRLSGRPMLAGALRKIRNTARQVELPLEARGENVRGAFRARRVARSLLLIDDVATSGATLGECARELKRRGAEHVFAVAFSRAIPEEN